MGKRFSTKTHLVHEALYQHHKEDWKYHRKDDENGKLYKARRTALEENPEITFEQLLEITEETLAAKRFEKALTLMIDWERFTIRNKEGYVLGVIEAYQNGSLDSLLDKLDYLKHYGENNEDIDFRITINGGDRGGFDVCWETKKKNESDNEFKYWMNGGLIHHDFDNSWSVHT